MSVFLLALMAVTAGPGPVVVQLTASSDFESSASLRFATEFAGALEAHTGRRVLIDVGAASCNETDCMLKLAARFKATDVMTVRLVGGVVTQVLAQICYLGPQAAQPTHHELFVPIDPETWQPRLHIFSKTLLQPLRSRKSLVIRSSAPEHIATTEPSVPWGPATLTSSGVLSTMIGAGFALHSASAANELRQGVLSQSRATELRSQVSRDRGIGYGLIGLGSALASGGIAWLLAD